MSDTARVRRGSQGWQRFASLLVFVIAFLAGATPMLALPGGEPAVVGQWFDIAAPLVGWLGDDRIDRAVAIAVSAMIFLYFVPGLFLGLAKWIRWERFGDNLYYLGFLFTLVALVVALMTLDTTGLDSAEPLFGRLIELVGSTAFALVTTILGLMLRLGVQQMCAEPDDDRTPEADIVARELRTLGDAIEGAATKLDALAADASERTDTAVDRATDAVAEAGQAVAHNIEERLGPRLEAFAAEVEAASRRIAKVELDTSVLSRQLDTQLREPIQSIGEAASDLTGVGVIAGDAGRGLKKLGDQATATREALETQTSVVGKIRDSFAEIEAQHRRTATAATQTIDELGTAIELLKGHIGGLDTHFRERHRDLEDRTDALAGKIETWVTTINALDVVLERQTQSLQRTLDGLEQASEGDGALTTVRALPFLHRLAVLFGRMPGKGT